MKPMGEETHNKQRKEIMRKSKIDSVRTGNIVIHMI
jgi:hypothetical protein